MNRKRRGPLFTVELSPEEHATFEAVAAHHRRTRANFFRWLLERAAEEMRAEVQERKRRARAR